MKGRVWHIRGTLHDEEDVTWEDGGYTDEQGMMWLHLGKDQCYMRGGGGFMWEGGGVTCEKGRDMRGWGLHEAGRGGYMTHDGVV